MQAQNWAGKSFLYRWLVRAVPLLCLLLWIDAPVTGQSGAKNGEWRTYGGDTGNTRYSPLDQINADNFKTLEVAWRFKTDNLGPRPEYQFEGTPLVANGVLYSTGGSRRAVIALDAATGELKWIHSENEGARGAAPEGGALPASDSSLSVQGLPLAKPPYGQINAIDLNKGEILWQIAHGETPDNVRNHPALKGLNIPRTGRPGIIGTLVTKTLLVAGESGFFTLPDGRRGAMLRGYGKATGKEVGAVYMPAPQSGSPMTYTLNGKQHIVVAISGGNYSGELVPFRLPS